ncbi:ras-related protein ORAB-1-like [Saccostrea cucullata]|uniref:ras-related protein ORAB-1-like n=1 Tax=Saccostrea cuccullata TaxID=36930 RepID=UPI002ED66133
MNFKWPLSTRLLYFCNESFLTRKCLPTYYSRKMDANRNAIKEYHFKLIVIGDPEVGKSSLVARLLDDYPNTVNYNHRRLKYTKNVSIEDSVVKLQIHDTAGQERYRSLTQSYYRGTHACFFVFDTRKPNSFDSINSWMEEFNFYADSQKSVNTIIGTNCCSSERVVDQQTLKNFASFREVDYLEVDLECNVNVSDISEELCANLLKKMKENSSCHHTCGKYTVSLHRPSLTKKITNKICEC